MTTGGPRASFRRAGFDRLPRVGARRATSASRPSASPTASAMRPSSAARHHPRQGLAAHQRPLAGTARSRPYAGAARAWPLERHRADARRGDRAQRGRPAVDLRARPQPAVLHLCGGARLPPRHPHARRRHVRDGLFGLPRLPQRDARRRSARRSRSAWTRRCDCRRRSCGSTRLRTWALADELGGAPLVELIVEDTHTCYLGIRSRRHAWGYGCGHCPACDLRAKGWRAMASHRRSDPRRRSALSPETGRPRTRSRRATRAMRPPIGCTRCCTRSRASRQRALLVPAHDARHSASTPIPRPSSKRYATSISR